MQGNLTIQSKAFKNIQTSNQEILINVDECKG